MTLKITSISNPPSDPCGICRDSLNDGQSVIAHEQNGLKHPFHKECLKASIKSLNGNCPLCKCKIDFQGLISRTDKLAIIAKEVVPSVLSSGIVTALGTSTILNIRDWIYNNLAPLLCTNQKEEIQFLILTYAILIYLYLHTISKIEWDKKIFGGLCTGLYSFVLLSKLPTIYHVGISSLIAGATAGIAGFLNIKSFLRIR